MDTNIARIMVFDEYASCEFEQPTSPTLKSKIKDFSWLKWRKKTVGEKEYWKLIVDMAEDKSHLTEFASLLRAEDVKCKIKMSKDEDWKDYPYVNSVSTSTEKDGKYFVYMKPSYYRKLSGIAQEKGIGFSQLIICATEEYLRKEKIAEPLKVLDHTVEAGTFSEKVKMEIARRSSTRAWVADKLGIDRSRFYRLIDTDKWTEDEKLAVCRLFGW